MTTGVASQGSARVRIVLQYSANGASLRSRPNAFGNSIRTVPRSPSWRWPAALSPVVSTALEASEASNLALAAMHDDLAPKKARWVVGSGWGLG